MQATTSYKLNPDAAKTVGVSNSIREKGAYVGKFTRAEAIVSQSGTQGIEFAFESMDGQSSDYLALWTFNSQGEPLHGRKVIDAIMTCVKVREMEVVRATVKKRNKTGQVEDTPANVFLSLMNKPIGVLLVREEYEKNDGTVGWKMTLVGAFDAANRKMPKEILENLPAELLERAIPMLQDRPLKKKAGAGTPMRTAPTGTGFVPEMDDDIPF
jgi:hypothetical protein